MLLKGIFILLLISLFTLQVHNTYLYPAIKGFDFRGHNQYLEIIRDQKKIPLANEGWEAYQPPLYYILASFLPTVKSVQFMNLLTWTGLILLTYFFIRQKFKDNFFGILGAFIVGSLPVVLYLTPMISNELFSGVLISATLIYYLLIYKKKKKNSWREDIFLGLLIGLSLLAKATSAVLLFAIILDICIDYRWRIKEIFNILWKPLFIAGVIGGWYYIRNIIVFGYPFVTSVDFPQYSFNQGPGHRDLNFFFDPSGFLIMDLFKAHHYSLWAGTYFSWFYDGHNALVPVQEYSRNGIMLVLASIPLFILSVWGFITQARKIDKSNRVLFLYPILLFISFIAYNFKLPFYSTVKAIFLVSCVIPWVYFLMCGLQDLVKRNKYIIYVFIIFLGIYYFLIIKNFWIMEWWYAYLK